MAEIILPYRITSICEKNNVTLQVDLDISYAHMYADAKLDPIRIPARYMLIQCILKTNPRTEAIRIEIFIYLKRLNKHCVTAAAHNTTTDRTGEFKRRCRRCS